MLDLYCCEGGAAKGYHDAGFDVVGVDIVARFARRYPYEFHVADAVKFVSEHGHEFDVIHASPPCQHASAGTRAQDRSRYPALIEPTREALEATAKPYVIENVKGAALRNPLTLCGRMFELEATDTDGTRLVLDRHRLFESNVHIFSPAHPKHGSEQVAGSYGGARRDKHEARYVRGGGYVPSALLQQQLLGIDWMTQYGMFQSVPPAYTEYVGGYLMEHLEVAAETPRADPFRHNPTAQPRVQVTTDPWALEVASGDSPTILGDDTA